MIKQISGSVHYTRVRMRLCEFRLWLYFPLLHLLGLHLLSEFLLQLLLPQLPLLLRVQSRVKGGQVGHVHWWSDHREREWVCVSTLDFTNRSSCRAGVVWTNILLQRCFSTMTHILCLYVVWLCYLIHTGQYFTIIYTFTRCIIYWTVLLEHYNIKVFNKRYLIYKESGSAL